MKFFYLTIALLLYKLPEADSQAFTMVVMEGSVATEVPSVRGTVNETFNCTAACANDTECILAYWDSDNKCVNYKYSEFDGGNNIKVDLSSKEFKVAIKTNKIDQCPSDTTPFGNYPYMDIRNGANLAYEWVPSGNELTLVNPCPAPGQPFRRTESLVVCIWTFNETVATREEAKTFCIGKGLKLTGIANKDEILALGGGRF